MQQFFLLNGKLFPAGTPVLGPASRAFRFGDSLFETIRMEFGKPLLFKLHIERLIAGMTTLGFDIPFHFNEQKLVAEMVKLAAKNGVSKYGRIRLTVFRKEGGLYDPVSNLPEYIIECSELPDNYQRLNENGFDIDIAADNIKGGGPLANLKTGNYLLYVLAAQAARERKVNECLVLNSFGRIADSSIFNVFIVKDGVVSTPALEEGPVAGVLRRHLIDHFRNAGNPVEEAGISIADLESADEIFLTNALYRIRWVKSFRSKTYPNQFSANLYSKLFQQNRGGIVSEPE